MSFESGPWGCYGLEYFDQLARSDAYRIEKISHLTRAGIGAPLSALRENRHAVPIERYFPKEAITRAVTAVIQPGLIGKGVQSVAIWLLCPRLHGDVTIRGKTSTLAADFSVPWALYLSRTGELNRSRLTDMFTRSPKREPQLFLMEAYDPKKEPLIMIHGLMSSPLAWIELTNQLWADDTIRQRYQVWHFLYNTSAPALYSARMFRTQLRELRRFLDPSGDGVVSRRATLVCHSMGGIISRAHVVSPGDAFWRAAFTVPPEKLRLSPADRATLKEAFEWHEDPTIHRIVFIAVPHKGSPFADNIVGRLGRVLYTAPGKFQEFYRRIATDNPGTLKPAYAGLAKGRHNSAHVLSPKHPTLQILSGLPISSSVNAHSIIGNRDRPGPLAVSSDGFVPYSSSHLPQAESEIVVPSGHSAYQHPAAVTEIKRILLLPAPEVPKRP